MTDNNAPPSPIPHLPRPEPRVWVISSGDSPIGISLARQILENGDCVVAGLVPTYFPRDERRLERFRGFLGEVDANGEDNWKARFRPVVLDIRMMSACQAAIAEATKTFGKIDILVCCTSQGKLYIDLLSVANPNLFLTAIVGTVEELAASQRTLNLVRDQFESNYFGPVNIIRAALPHMRKQKAGHIQVLSGITAHLGTPGLGVYCAAQWALEGFCDSIAYEIAPFNIKLSILQCSIEILILTNLITTVPPINSAYSPSTNHAPLFRNILGGLISRLPTVDINTSNPSTSSTQTSSDIYDRADSEEYSPAINQGPHIFSVPKFVSMQPPLGTAHSERLTAETVHAIMAIGGHENPPSRHIVGQEGIASVKEKLKTVSEELEDFIQSSLAVDIPQDEDSVRT
ncbi:hypothetical protein Egran_00594 [Elaphomyces granulatus]|uniref:Ketoreductase (KR) domain-containing protein n=1 Tax=Elaphomyces granulatus TaxID=519963 RepID=A0A232M5J0_9EURO|nr:hypothetical protein Egran_00594 [Elaphomyces granulatus]